MGLGQNTHSKMKTALLKPRSRTMGEIFYVHNDDINTCVRNQQDYTLGLFEWVEEEIESENVWGGKKREGETIWLSCICGSYIFSNARGLTVNHLARFWICRLITARYKASWHRGWRYIFFTELRGNVTVSPLKPCIYALLMKCDGERSWVCLHGGEGIFVHSLHVTVLIHERSCLFRVQTKWLWITRMLMCLCASFMLYWAGF